MGLARPWDGRKPPGLRQPRAAWSWAEVQLAGRSREESVAPCSPSTSITAMRRLGHGCRWGQDGQAARGTHSGVFQWHLNQVLRLPPPECRLRQWLLSSVSLGQLRALRGRVCKAAQGIGAPSFHQIPLSCLGKALPFCKGCLPCGWGVSRNSWARINKHCQQL